MIGHCLPDRHLWIGERVAALYQTFNVKDDRLAYHCLNFLPTLSCCNATGQFGHIGTVVVWRPLINNSVIEFHRFPSRTLDIPHLGRINPTHDAPAAIHKMISHLTGNSRILRRVLVKKRSEVYAYLNHLPPPQPNDCRDWLVSCSSPRLQSACHSATWPHRTYHVNLCPNHIFEFAVWALLPQHDNRKRSTQ